MGSVARVVLQNFLDKKIEEEEIVYKMVLEALDGPGQAKQNIKRLSLFREEDAINVKEEEEIEEGIRADIEMLQVTGLQNIGTQYMGILKMKVEELDRVKKELTQSNSYYRALYKETAHWKEVFDNATFNQPDKRMQLKQVPEQNVTDVQGAVYKEQWQDVTRPFWQKALQTDEDDQKSQSQYDEAKLQHAQGKSASDPTVLPNRIPPEEMSDDLVYGDPASLKEQKKSDKCNII